MKSMLSVCCRTNDIPFYVIAHSPDEIIHITFSKEKHKKALKLIESASGKVQKGRGAFQNTICQELKKIMLNKVKDRGNLLSSPFLKSGTEFQKQVWKQIYSIPYGETRTYGELAKSIGRPKAARAVGMACNANPVALIIPCHRVVGSNGLGGFAGGLAVKEKILGLEKQK